MGDFLSSGESIINFFPSEKYSIREAQKKVLEGIEWAIKQGKKYVLIQAPTGVGKSAISYAVLRGLEEGYVCSSTKALQEQYLNDFQNFLSVKGRSNFDCLERKDGASCDKGACEVLDFACKRKPSTQATQYTAFFSVRDNCTKYWPESKEALTRCPYWTEKVNCLNNFASVHNYSYLITESNYVGEFTKKKVLISDEGHNIEGQLINFIKLPITQDHLDKVNKFLDSGNKFSFQRTGLNTPNFEKLQIHAQWVEKLNGSIVIAIEKIKSLAKQALTEKEYLEYEFKNASDKDKGNIGEMIDGKLKRLDDLQGDLKSLESLQENQIAFFLRDIAESLDNWVVYEQYSKTGAIEKIEFQPIRVSKYAYDKYLRLGDLNIIMSATILDYTRVASDLGIDLKEAHYIEIEPPFPAERHKIFNLGIADFGYCQTETKQQKDEFYRQVVERIDSILDLFPEERGIIHATTYEITSYLKHNSKHCNRLTFHGSKDRSQKLEEHKQKKGSVLVSPSMTEGVDLKGEFSKFQILIKVPFPDLSDERIKKRKAVDPASYNFRTANTIIQSIGRSVRSEKDECITFTLDSRFGGFCQWNYKMMKLFNRHIRPNSDLVKLFGAENARNLVKPIARGSKDKVKAYVKPY